MAAAYAGCDPIIVGTFLTIAVGAQGLQTSGQFVNPIDLSPNYSGTVFALYNGIGCIFGVLVPVFVGLLTPNVRIFIYFINLTCAESQKKFRHFLLKIAVIGYRMADRVWHYIYRRYN